MTWEDLIGRLKGDTDRYPNFIEHEDGVTFLVFEGACWLDAEETEEARALFATVHPHKESTAPAPDSEGRDDA